MLRTRTGFASPKALRAVNDKGTSYQDAFGGMTDHKQLTSFISWGRRNPRAMIEQSGKMIAELKKLNDLPMQAQERQLQSIGTIQNVTRKSKHVGAPQRLRAPIKDLGSSLLPKVGEKRNVDE